MRKWWKVGGLQSYNKRFYVVEGYWGDEGQLKDYVWRWRG